MITEVDAFFDTNDFAEDAVYTDAAGTAKTIPVIFDRQPDTQLIISIETQGARPQALARTSDTPNAEKETGATLNVRNITYTIVEANPDGFGVTTLILSLN